jgi:hypothetical protein
MDLRLAGNLPLEELHGTYAGRAKLLLAILPDGRVEVLKTISQSAPNYAEACRRALQKTP